MLDTTEVEASECGASGGDIPFFRVICADSPDVLTFMSRDSRGANLEQGRDGCSAGRCG